MNNYPKIYLYRRIVQAKLFIDARYAERIDLASIADEALITRLFKSVYGSTPHRYLTHVRIQNAKCFLDAGISATEVCYRVGFESIGSFSTLFKRHVGMTPALYQRHRHQRKIEMQQMPLRFIPNCFADKKGWLKKSNIEEVFA
jgi:AraC-like DNA-binding protein